MKTKGTTSAVSRYLATVITLFSFWILVTSEAFTGFLSDGGSPDAAVQEIMAGAFLSLLLSFWGYRYLTEKGLSIFAPKRILNFILFIPVFFYACLKANLDVAYRAIHPKMPIKPGIVVIKTKLKTDVGKLLLANSITLTPGTLTIDVCGEYLFIHWINVKTEDEQEAAKLISARFEKYIKAITE